MRRARARTESFLALIAAVAVGTVSVAAAEERKPKVFGRSEPGRHAAFAQGKVRNPDKIYVLVDEPVGEVVSVNTAMECERGARYGDRDSSFLATAPAQRSIKLAMRKPRACRVSVTAALEEGGEERMKVRLAVSH
jgi:hypothetical protein